MPRNKDLKRLVRTRMLKTGESYTTARAQLLRKKPRKTIKTAAVGKVDYAKLAGMSDAKVKEATGCAWEKWVKSLDHYGADKLPHREIAQLIKDKYDTPDWWTQTVAVGYERIKGLRAQGQQRDGTYQAGKSKTFNFPVADVFNAFVDASTRRRWLDETGVKIRTSIENRSVRLQMADGAIVAVGFDAKSPTKTMVAVQQEKLLDRDAIARVKELWTERFAALAQLLEA